ncbi:MAG: RDD family protein [Bacteroidota bacterium]
MATPATSDPSLATRTRSVLVRRAAAFVLDMSFALTIALSFAVSETAKERFFGAGLLLGGLYLLFRDGLPIPKLRGRSIGKRMLWLLPIRLGGTTMDWKASAKRNWSIAMVLLFPGLANLTMGYRQIVLAGNIGVNDALLGGFAVLLIIEALLVLVDPVARRIGDRIANTRVIEG